MIATSKLDVGRLPATGNTGGTPERNVPEDGSHPILVRRWRNGRIVWEGPPQGPRTLHRRYPMPVPDRGNGRKS